MTSTFDEIDEVEVKSQPQIRLTTTALVGYAALVMLVVLGFLFGGEGASFAQTGLTFLPFLVIAVLAYLGIRYPAARVLAVLWLFSLLGIYILVVAGFSVMATVDLNAVFEDATPDPALLSTVMSTGGLAVVALLVALLGFIPAVRRGISRLLPLDPDSFVHTIALVSVTAMLLMSYVPLIVLGQPPLLSDAMLDAVQESQMTGTSGLLAQVYTMVWTVPVAIFAVGFGIRRSLRETFARLGFVAPSLRQVLIGVGAALLMVLAMNVLDVGLTWLWQTMGWPQTDAEAFGELLAFALSPLGAVVIGVTAGLGEELGVRGVLQPRLGILLSNLFFTSLHAFQYNWDSLLVVFLLGTIFGVLRKYTNTSTAAITHGLYNFLTVMMSLYGISLLGN
ncbi:MAG: CPBP family intramembrane metalloprotease [Caldilineaceae bacterium]|nr:CPBP family intramembrane metalloprotease [Caldilineaceae bacterium]